MSKIAVKIMRNVASSPPPYSWTTEDFYDYEVRDIPIMDGRESIVKRLGTGLPKIIKRTGYGTVTITFLLHWPAGDGASTLDKLKNLETFDGSDQRLIIYPKYQKDPETVRICKLATGQIPDEVGRAGWNAHGGELTVTFYEVEKGVGGTVLDEDEV